MARLNCLGEQRGKLRHESSKGLSVSSDVQGCPRGRIPLSCPPTPRGPLKREAEWGRDIPNPTAPAGGRVLGSVTNGLIPGWGGRGLGGRGAGVHGAGGRGAARGWCQAHRPGPQSFAEQTLRTLCLAYKEVDEAVFEGWRQRHQEASILLQNRAQALHQVYEEMEQNLQVGRVCRGCPQPPRLPRS